MSILHRMRLLLRRLGFEAYRANPMTMWQLRLARLLSQKGIVTVLDVGANDGGFASDILDGGFGGKVISFEPLPRAWASLKERASRRPQSWVVAPRMALSDRYGQAKFYESANSVSSSLFPMTGAHIDAAPTSRAVDLIEVPTRRLDDVLPELMVEGPIFLKIDVQGAEDLVLAGARKSLSGPIVGVQLEMSLTPLYENQAAACELDLLLKEQGFECWDMLPGFRNPDTLRLLQYDGIYFRSAL